MQSHPPPTPVLIVLILFGAVAGIFYLLTLQKALTKCAPASRTMKPGKVWLVLIPLFGHVWQFFVVTNIAKSLRNEFARLGAPCLEQTPGQNVGLTACVCALCATFIPRSFPFLLLRDLAAVVGFFSWIAYWVRIANYSRLLGEYQTAPPALPNV
jgi:hypothetical protein